jgi:hypothetical protein
VARTEVRAAAARDSPRDSLIRDDRGLPGTSAPTKATIIRDPTPKVSRMPQILLPPSPIRIDPDAVYTVGAIVLTLDISSTTVGRARRAGELKCVRRGRHVYVLGRDLLAWLSADTTGNEVVS